MQEHRATNKGSPVINGKLDFHIRRTLVRAKGPHELAEEAPRFQSRQKHTNIFKQQQNPETTPVGLSEEHVKASRVYRML